MRQSIRQMNRLDQPPVRLLSIAATTYWENDRWWNTYKVENNLQSTFQDLNCVLILQYHIKTHEKWIHLKEELTTLFGAKQSSEFVQHLKPMYGWVHSIATESFCKKHKNTRLIALRVSAGKDRDSLPLSFSPSPSPSLSPTLCCSGAERRQLGKTPS